MGSCVQGLFTNDRFQAVYVDGAGKNGLGLWRGRNRALRGRDRALRGRNRALRGRNRALRGRNSGSDFPL